MFGSSTGVIVRFARPTRSPAHVDANQRSRMTMYKVIDELHSACVASQIAPVQTGSTGTLLSFLHQSGSAVSPTPVLSKISLNGTTLSQSDYASTGGTAPTWTFSSTPSSTIQLMTGVSPTSGSSIFNYYAYSNGQVASTPLTTPLSSTDAAKTVQVSVAFKVAPSTTPVVDSNGADRDPGQRPAALLVRHLQHQRQQPAMPVKQPTPESGFTMVATILAMSLVMLLAVVAVAAVNGDTHLTRNDLDHKQAYEAAKAGIDDYAFHLNADSTYWSKCTGVPTPNAVNQQGSTTKQRAVPGSTGATYAIELIPATGKTTCDPTTLNTATASMIEASGLMAGSFRIRSTGFSGKTKVSIVATFKPASFLDYMYFTQLETSDPGHLRIREPLDRARPAPTPSAPSPGSRAATTTRSREPTETTTATKSPSSPTTPSTGPCTPTTPWRSAAVRTSAGSPPT